uniref:hypothetical protein n=1 Tax=Pararhizobium sp. IMCC3301 TaxID=3067904 RepID=UPI0027427482|nr:hypothetical protein [Pararhizobium sp. IMCC3301]
MAQSDAGLISGKIRELTRLIRETRLAETLSADPERMESSPEHASGPDEMLVHKMRAQTRLEALAQSLRSVHADIPKVAQARQDAFTFALLPGNPPRFWVDLSSFVVMSDGGKTFHFLKDTQNGRISLFRSNSLEDTVDAVTDYVAERIVRHRSAAPTDQQQKPVASKSTVPADKAEKETPAVSPVARPAGPEVAIQQPVLPPPIIIQPAPPTNDWVKLFLAFTLGLFVGAVLLFIAAWLQTPAAT